MKRVSWFEVSSFLIALAFTLLALFRKNYEFLAYIFVVLVMVFIIIKTDKYFKYPLMAKISFIIWFFLHMAGGLFLYQGRTWYRLVLVKIIGEPYNILRYDQILHFFVYFTTSIFIFFFVKSLISKKPSKLSLIVLVSLASMGLGALNEVLELAVYVYYENSGVGTYINNALDLIFNMIGAIGGSIFAIKKYS